MNLSLSILEEPKSKNKTAFYAQVLFFSMLVVSIGYIFFQVYKKVSSGDFASAPNADILQLIQKSIGEWSVQGVDVEKVHKALYWNKHGQIGDGKVVLASDIIQHSNLLLGMPLLKEHSVMLSNVRKVELYYKKYNEWVAASEAASDSPYDSYEVLQGYENIKVIEHFMSQKNVDLTTSVVSINSLGMEVATYDTKTIDHLYCERMSSLWNPISMQNGNYIHPSSISSFITDASICPDPKICSLDVSKREWFNRTYPDKTLDFTPDWIGLPDLIPPLTPPKGFDYVGTTPYPPFELIRTAKEEQAASEFSASIDRMQARHAARLAAEAAAKLAAEHADKPADNGSSGGNSDN